METKVKEKSMEISGYRNGGERLRLEVCIIKKENDRKNI